MLEETSIDFGAIDEIFNSLTAKGIRIAVLDLPDSNGCREVLTSGFQWDREELEKNPSRLIIYYAKRARMSGAEDRLDPLDQIEQLDKLSNMLHIIQEAGYQAERGKCKNRECVAVCLEQ